MATLNAEHINPFLMTAKKILQDVCFVEVAIQKPVLKEASFSADDWVIIVGVTGEMRGQVLIAMSEKNACAIASKMCMTDPIRGRNKGWNKGRNLPFPNQRTSLAQFRKEGGAFAF